MKLLLIALLLWAVNAQAATTDTTIRLQPVSIGAEWTGANGYAFALTCFSPKSGGVSCIRFPNGANIYAIQFQTSSKLGTEMLWNLTFAQNGGGQFGSPPEDEKVLVATHHVPGDSSTVVRDITLPGVFRVPAGGYVYVRGFGVATGTPDAEMQATVWVLEGTVNFRQ
jgi:hypothetical protein